MLASVTTFALEGVASHEVTVEVDVRRGLSTFTLVGLPDRAVRESRERVRAALLNSGLEFPQKRITVNLAPAHVRKEGPSFDLAIAVGVLVASGQLTQEQLGACALCGELSLTGELRPIRGALATALGARRCGYRRLLVPEENAAEAALVDEMEVHGIPSLGRIADLLHGRWVPERAAPSHPEGAEPADPLDLGDVRGQDDAKRALEIAAAGGHNLLMIGPPGAGKTMLARRLPGMLPPPTFEEALEVTQVHGAAGIGEGRLATRRPFRAPHHTISAQGLVGGGSRPMPGEITLAHRGVLFLDELPEFSRAAVDALRQPLEDGRVTIMRGQRALDFPATRWSWRRATAVRARGRRTDAPAPRSSSRATCGASAARCSTVSTWSARSTRRRRSSSCYLAPAGARTHAVRRRVANARLSQQSRLAGTGALCNGDMDGRLTRREVPLDESLTQRMLEARCRLDLSGRGHDRVLRVARTIADLDGREGLAESDLDEALSYRLDGLDLMAA